MQKPIRDEKSKKLNLKMVFIEMFRLRKKSSSRVSMLKNICRPNKNTSDAVLLHFICTSNFYLSEMG